MGAAVRRAEREAQRRQKEVDQLERERTRLLEHQIAASQVAAYEDFIKRITSIHTEIGEAVDWQEILNSQGPPMPVKTRHHENEARRQLDSYKPGFLDKLFKKHEAKLLELEAEIEVAKVRDTSDFEEAERCHINEMKTHEERKELAGHVLRCDPAACTEILRDLSPFQEISDLGSQIQFSLSLEDGAVVDVEVDVHGEDIVPREKKYLLKNGGLSTKQLPKGQFYEIFQDYVCGCCLRVAGEIFAVLPAAVSIVTAMDQILNTKTGHMERQPILSVVIPRSTFESLNLSGLDPSDSMANFLHEMRFAKTKGFAPVKKITYDGLPDALKHLGPQMPSSDWVERLAASRSSSIASRPTEGPAWATEARRLLDEGKKIHAIKLVREETSMPLKDAKELVESWEH